MPLPPAYVAFRSLAPVASSKSGSPATVTLPLNATVMLIVAPAPYVPSASGEVTFRTVGTPSAVPNRVRWYVQTALSGPESIWHSRTVPTSVARAAARLSALHSASIALIASPVLLTQYTDAPALPVISTRTGSSNTMCVLLSPISITRPSSSADASPAPRAAASAARSGAQSDTYSSSRPSAGTDVAFTPGGSVTTANDALIVTPSGGSVTLLAAGSGPRPASPARAVTLIAARAPSPASETSTSRTNPAGVMATGGAWPPGLDTAASLPAAPTSIVSLVNTYRVRSAPTPDMSARTAICPVCVMFTPGPSNCTLCTAVPTPSSPTASASRPPGPVTAPYTGPA